MIDSWNKISNNKLLFNFLLTIFFIYVDSVSNRLLKTGTGILFFFKLIIVYKWISQYVEHNKHLLINCSEQTVPAPNLSIQRPWCFYLGRCSLCKCYRLRKWVREVELKKDDKADRIGHNANILRKVMTPNNPTPITSAKNNETCSGSVYAFQHYRLS